MTDSHSGDVEGTHAWRCQLFRLLDPPNAAEGTAAARIKDVAATSRELAARGLAMDLLNAVADLLIPAVDAEAAEPGLEAILRTSAELSQTFWTRKQWIYYRGLTALVPAGLADQPLKYQASATDMETHPLHSVDLDDDPEALDGREVVLLCNPAVVAFGTADGKDYDKTKLWRKAVVWLG